MKHQNKVRGVHAPAARPTWQAAFLISSLISLPVFAALTLLF